jgi:hypothetical protein
VAALRLHYPSNMKLQTISLDQLSNVTGGAAPVTADNFMPRAYALQSLNAQNEKSPNAKTSAAIHSEFCGSLYPYAKSGKPINSMFGSIARSKVTEEGAKICK